MNIGINENIDPKVISFYESFYDLLRTPDFNENSRLLKPGHGMRYYGSPKNKVCRFCGKSEGEVSFKKIAHVFPEAIGNSVLASYYECDICNQFFGNGIENEYSNFFSLYHSIMQISGKKGKPACSFKVPCDKRTDKCKEYCIEFFINGDQPCLCECKEVKGQYVEQSKNAIRLSKPVGRCNMIAVYKAIVKMAISIMPVEELESFSKTIDWLLETEHSNIYPNKQLLVRYKMIPGFNVTKYPCYCLYRRKKTVWNKPYMIFNLTYGCFSLLIEVPRSNETSSDLEFKKLPFPPIPFYTSEEGCWNMTYTEVPKGTRNSIILNFSKQVDYTDRVEIADVNGKRKINITNKQEEV